MPRQKQTQQQQGNSGSTNQAAPAQPLAPTNQTDEQAQHASDGTAASQPHEAITADTRERRVQNWLLVIFTGLVFVVTGVYAYFTWGQWTAVEQSLEETRKNRELEYRAYLGVRGVVFQPRQDNPAWGDIILISTNTGRTPAIGMGDIKRAIEQRDAPPPEDAVVKGSEHPGSKVIYVPSMDFRSKLGMITTNVADLLIAAPLVAAPPVAARPGAAQPAASPTPIVPTLRPPEDITFVKGWYVYGIIEYKDIFDKPHRTKFCYYNAIGTRDFFPCPTFNDAE